MKNTKDSHAESVGKKSVCLASIRRQKDILRQQSKQIRNIVWHKIGNRASKQLVSVYLALNREIQEKFGKIIGGYWPINSEINTIPLLQFFAQQNRQCALPVITSHKNQHDQNRILKYRSWQSETSLKKGKYGIPQPGLGCPQIYPDSLLVPLLAFDSFGNRLGQGGGYYDQTLRFLRQQGKKPVFAVGLAFSGQQRSAIPCESHDEKLDAILTEKDFIFFGQ